MFAEFKQCHLTQWSKFKTWVITVEQWNDRQLKWQNVISKWCGILSILFYGAMNFGWYFKETARSMLRDQFSLLNFPLDPVCGGVPTPGGHLSTEPLSATANSKPTIKRHSPTRDGLLAARLPCMRPGNKWLDRRSWRSLVDGLTPSKTSRCAASL